MTEHFQNAVMEEPESSMCQNLICPGDSQCLSFSVSPAFQEDPSDSSMLDIRRKFSFPNTRANLLASHLHLSPNNLPSHLSPATQTLLGLLEALSLLLLFAIDSDNGSRDTNGDGEDRVESSELKRNNQKGTWLVGTLY
jgi:hypothetical protein